MKKYLTVKEYLAGFDRPAQTKLKQIITITEEQAPDAKQTFAYGIPTYKLNGKNVIHLAAYQRHIGLYPGPATVAKFKDEIKGLSTSKGTIQLPLDKPLPLDLIRRIVRFARENNA